MKSMYVYVRTKVHFISTCRATKQFGCRFFFNRREHFFLKEKKTYSNGTSSSKCVKHIKTQRKKICQAYDPAKNEFMYGKDVVRK